MKKILFLYVLIAFISSNCMSQELTAKEKGEDLAKNVFSKSKHAKKEKYGVVKEKTKVVESTPFVKSNVEYYAGNYWYHDFNYKMEIRLDVNKNLMATLSIPNKPDVQLKKVSVTDAYFMGIKQNEDGTEEKWEGVFINKSDNGNTEFGLGIKLQNPLPIADGVQTTKIFFKKVSP